MIARIVFGLVDFAARKGLVPIARKPANGAQQSVKQRARLTGLRGETYAYWYLRRRGYMMVARNYMVPGLKGEIDMAGYDGRVLAFVEVKTRSMSETGKAIGFVPPESAIDNEKVRNVGRMARQFLRARRIEGEPYRFDVLAIEARAGQKPIVRLHKGAYAG